MRTDARELSAWDRDEFWQLILAADAQVTGHPLSRLHGSSGFSLEIGRAADDQALRQLIISTGALQEARAVPASAGRLLASSSGIG